MRKRLDFDKPVPRELLLECLEIAVQAPTGANAQGWQWIFVDDQPTKDALAEIYRDNYAEYAKSTRARIEKLVASGNDAAAQALRVSESSNYLAENYHRAPVMMIPVIRGRIDGASASESAGFWGSLLPAVWSFMLAARERALGTTWTTIHLNGDGGNRAAEVLGIPNDQYTQAGLIPIAYTLGTDFKPAERRPLEPLVHWNTW
ncbi:nitroreductase family protein [soil metagenome]